MKQFEVAVIGGGPGGYVAAIRAAQLGKKTVLVENREVGGTCLNRGCIPTKALLHGAEVYAEIQHAKAFGVIAQAVTLDYAKLAGFRDDVVKKLRGGIVQLLKENGVTTVSAKAVLTGKNTFAAGGADYEADSIILATGSAPAKPPIPGVERALTSDEVLHLQSCPESVVIVGGGVIGIEFATLFASLGKKVAVIEMLPTILAGMDEEIIAAQLRVLKRNGVAVYTGAKVQSIGTVCTFEQNGKTLEERGEIVVIAAGRRPVTADLGLEKTGVRSEKGFVLTDAGMRTNVPSIFAIGDITGKLQLAHVASAQALVAAHNACGENRTMRYNAVPSCIYTSPEIASVGLTEKQAKEQGYEIKIGSFPVMANGRSMIMGCRDGVAKLITDAKTGEILGGHLMAPRATDLIGEIAVAMRAEATIEELADTIHAHPTVSEILMEAAHDVERLCVHKL